MKKYLILSLLTIFLIGSGFAGFYTITFKGLETSSTSLQTGQELGFETNIVNLAEEPYTDIEVQASLIRKSDKTQVYQTTINNDVDLAGREITTLDESLTVPEKTPSGNYSFVLTANTPSGVPTTFISDEVKIENPVEQKRILFGNKGVYLLTQRVVVGNNSIRTFQQPSYGTQGENVLPDTPFDIKFKIKNPGDESINPHASIDIIPTYSDDGTPVKEMEEDLNTLTVNEEETYNFETQMSDPGTYIVKVDIKDSTGEKIGSNQVRLVIAGKDGSITDVSNKRDVYKTGDTVEVNASIVGPADGSTTVTDTDLTLEVRKDDALVDSTTRNLEKLPLSPKTYTLEADAAEELDRYELKLTLSKDGKVYDTYSAQYQPLEAEKRLTDGGQVKEEGKCFDDGVCTQQEYEIGGCYDCAGVEEPPGKKDDKQEASNLPIAAILILGLLVTSLIGYRRLKKDEAN